MSEINIISKFMKVALQADVVGTALRVAIVVGTMLALINHSSAILDFSLSKQNIFQILLTYLVPYGVSTYSLVKAILGNDDQA